MSNDTTTCPNCGGDTDPAQRFCPHCGTGLEATAREHAELQPPAPEPGEPASPPTAQPTAAQPATAGFWRGRSVAARIAMVALPLVVAAGGVAVALLLSGTKTATQVGTSASSAVSAYVKEVEERRAKQAKYDSCKQQMEPLLESLSELDSRLGVGLSYDEYTDKVGNVRVAYDDIDFAEVSDTACLSDVGVPGEKALNQYAKAANVWSSCFDDFNCSNDSIKPTLQRHWSKATLLIDSAKEGLDSMKPVE
jgi:hypothetical protein